MLRKANYLTGKATFQDEMESLLYVVLYSALLWQRHNVSQKQLTKTIGEMFISCTAFEAGSKDGGDGKIANAKDRVYTRLVLFENESLDDWLKAVMDFHSPRRHRRAEYQDEWSHPEHLDAYWLSFLRTQTLESDDMVNNKLDHGDLYDSITPPSFPVSSTPFTRAAATSVGPALVAPASRPNPGYPSTSQSADSS